VKKKTIKQVNIVQNNLMQKKINAVTNAAPDIVVNNLL
jgi:hypothetical protein